MNIKKLMILIILLQLFKMKSCSKTSDSDITPPDISGQQEEKKKETYLPKNAWNVVPNNDYQDSKSQFSLTRMKETSNLAAFWETVGIRLQKSGVLRIMDTMALSNQAGRNDAL